MWLHNITYDASILRGSFAFGRFTLMAPPLCLLMREKQVLENSMVKFVVTVGLQYLFRLMVLKIDISCGQLLFIPLYCNFKEVSQIQKIKSRKLYAWRDTGERMKRNMYFARNWMLKGKKNVGFVWR